MTEDAPYLGGKHRPRTNGNEPFLGGERKIVSLTQLAPRIKQIDKQLDILREIYWKYLQKRREEDSSTDLISINPISMAKRFIDDRVMLSRGRETERLRQEKQALEAKGTEILSQMPGDFRLYNLLYNVYGPDLNTDITIIYNTFVEGVEFRASAKPANLTIRTSEEMNGQRGESLVIKDQNLRPTIVQGTVQPHIFLHYYPDPADPHFIPSRWQIQGLSSIPQTVEPIFDGLDLLNIDAHEVSSQIGTRILG